MPPKTAIPLNQLDRMFYCLELLGYVPVSRIQVELANGTVDLDLFQQACRNTVQHYPIFRSRIKDPFTLFFWKPAWVPLEHIESHQFVQFHDLTLCTPGEMEEKSNDIQFSWSSCHNSLEKPPLHIAVCALPGNRYTLLFLFHHAAADGYGYYLFIKDVFDAYNELSSGRTPDISSVKPTFPPPSLLVKGFLNRLYGFFKAVGIIQRHTRLLKSLPPAKLLYGKTSMSGFIQTIQRSLCQNKMQRIQATADSRQMTINDVLIATQIKTIHLWKQSRKEPCRSVSIQVHQNIRTDGQHLQDHRNRFSTFIIMIPDYLLKKDFSVILQEVHSQSQSAKYNNMAANIINLSWLLDLRLMKSTVSLWGNALFNNSAAGDSFQITNVGKIWIDQNGRTEPGRLGSADISACYLVAPPIPSIGSCISFCGYNNALHMSFNYLEGLMSRRDAEQFMNFFENVLDELVSSIVQYSPANTI